jgi:hypothetical protein
MNTLSSTKGSEASHRMVTEGYEFSFYVVHGTLPKDAPSYVERSADTELYANLARGNFCYVLSQRQTGKSSLMVRTAARLQQESAAVVVIDLTGFGSNLVPEQWYYGLLDRIGQQLNIEDELDDYWMRHNQLGPLPRWVGAIRDVVLERHKGRVVLFIDEIDMVLSLPFTTDEFFAGIREFYNRRIYEPELSRLTFCLMGVATPSDLVRDIRITPFNIGTRIDLTDFSESEALPLTRGLGREGTIGKELIRRVLYWTGGHPYLTQRLCQAVAEDSNVVDATGVDRLCEELFLSSIARERDDNLSYVRHRLLRSDADTAELLTLYSDVRRYNGVEDSEFWSPKSWLGFKGVRADDASPAVSILWLSGIIRSSDSCLYVRNRIYHQVFDHGWVIANMPDAELRRQRKAYRQGLLRAAIIAAIVILLILALGIYGLVQRNRSRSALAEADRQRQVAEEQTKQVNLMTEERDWQEDLLIWELIKLDRNPATFEAYLEVNPPPDNARMAKQKLKALGSSSAAQVNGVIRGHVYDVDTKESLTGAIVTAKNQERSTEYKMFSNEHGEFMVPLLPLGLYTITIADRGYEKKSLTDFPVIAERINRITPEIGLRKNQ